MQTKVFSVKDGTLIVNSGNLFLCEDRQDEVPIATTFEADTNGSVYIIPSSLISKPKTDEELAEEYVKDDETGWGKNVNYDNVIVKNAMKDFLAGRKSVGGEFHLTREQVEKLIWSIVETGYYKHISDESMSKHISSLTYPIYPHTITVEHDGENYLWETLKAEY